MVEIKVIFEHRKSRKLRKLIIQIKRIAAALVIATSFFLFFPTAACALDKEIQQKAPTSIEQKPAEEESVFKKSYNVVYRFISNHEYLFAPLSGAIAGEVVCGPWCAAAGGVLGAIDEFSVYFGFTDKRYLTWGIFGLATGHVIQPSIVSSVGGFAMGVLLPTGTLNNYKGAFAPAISAIAGNSMSGSWGLVTSGVAGVLDELDINNGNSDNHRRTFCTVGMAATNLLGYFNPVVADFIGMILGSIAAEYEDKLSATLMGPIKTTANLYDIYGKFIPEDQLNTHIEKHALALVGSQFLVQFLSLKATVFRQNLNYNFERLDIPNGPAWGNFQSGLINFAVFLFPYAIGQIVSGRIDDYFCKKLQYSLEDEIRSELFSGENALRLSHDNNTAVLTDNLKEDVSTVTGSGTSLITGAVSASIDGVYGIGIIVVSSPNLFVYQTLYNQAQSFVANYLAAQQRSYGEKIREIESKLVTATKHDTENIRTITERDGIEFTKTKLQQLYEESRKNEASRELWSSASSLWWTISGIADFIFNYYLVGNEIHQKKIPFESRNKVQTASWQVSNLLSWPGHNARLVASIDQSLDRVVILEGKIHAPLGRTDQIIRVTKDGNQLILQDLEVGVADRLLVAVKDLSLEMGKAYAITGDSGGGKTSLLSKIKGVKENSIKGKGYIYYPAINGKMPKIVMLGQQDYFPTDSSLQGIISYPEVIPGDPVLKDKEREKIKLLLKEIGFVTAFNVEDVAGKNTGANTTGKKNEAKKESNGAVLDLDRVKDWYTVLSGGEKKKILIVSAIIKNPDILILDEIFNGLDPKSIIIVQQMLKKHLPNALILVVDHHAQDNNYDVFYNKELNFYNKSIVLRDISSKVLQEAIVTLE